MNTLVIGAGTVAIILFSWFLSIKHKRYHGIARFFSFESIFIMVLVNSKIWFVNPFSFLQILSWGFLLLSIIIVVRGYLLLRSVGKPTSNFENTSVLVREGIYGLIRHPLYLSLFLLGTGVMIKNPGRLQLILGTINLVAVYLTARIEENEMIARFGNDYRRYMRETKMFIPFIL